MSKQVGRTLLTLPKGARWVVTNAPRVSTMIKEEEVLTALDKPLALYALKQRLDPANRSTDALQELLMYMRSEGKVKFNINSGRWSRA